MLQIQKEVEWLIPQLQSIILDNSRLIKLLSEAEERMKNSELFKDLCNIKTSIEINNKVEISIREKGTNMMLENGLKKFEMLDGTTIQLNSTPGALVISEWVQLDPKYYKEKTTIAMDKILVKKDFMDWLILNPGVTIESEYKFIIKSK